MGVTVTVLHAKLPLTEDIELHSVMCLHFESQRDSSPTVLPVLIEYVPRYCSLYS